jgi:hypothetical protein
VAKYKSAAPKMLLMWALWFLSLITFRSNWVSKKIIVISEIANFQNWTKEHFPESKLFVNRESLWKEIVNTTSSNKRIIELGVAWGYTTNWFLKIGYPLRSKNQNTDLPKITIDAFDLFTGLPEAWRNHPENYFDNNGVPPVIDDERVTFHVGFVENTINNLDKNILMKEALIVLFDLDLYHPSLDSYLYLKPTLKVGDILYFDEAFDSDERKIIENQVLKDFLLKPVGHTALAICFTIEQVRN